MAYFFSGIDKWYESSYLENTYHRRKKKKPHRGRSCETIEPQSQKKNLVK